MAVITPFSLDPITPGSGGYDDPAAPGAITLGTGFRGDTQDGMDCTGGYIFPLEAVTGAWAYLFNNDWTVLYLAKSIGNLTADTWNEWTWDTPHEIDETAAGYSIAVYLPTGGWVRRSSTFTDPPAAGFEGTDHVKPLLAPTGNGLFFEGTQATPATPTVTAGTFNQTYYGIQPKVDDPSIAAGPPVNSVAPAVTGTPQVGETLSTTDGTWDPAATGYTYQWQRRPV